MPKNAMKRVLMTVTVVLGLLRHAHTCRAQGGNAPLYPFKPDASVVKLPGSAYYERKIETDIARSVCALTVFPRRDWINCESNTSSRSKYFQYPDNVSAFEIELAGLWTPRTAPNTDASRAPLALVLIPDEPTLVPWDLGTTRARRWLGTFYVEGYLIKDLSTIVVVTPRRLFQIYLDDDNFIMQASIPILEAVLHADFSRKPDPQQNTMMVNLVQDVLADVSELIGGTSPANALESVANACSPKNISVNAKNIKRKILEDAKNEIAENTKNIEKKISENQQSKLKAEYFRTLELTKICALWLELSTRLTELQSAKNEATNDHVTLDRKNGLDTAKDEDAAALEWTTRRILISWYVEAMRRKRQKNSDDFAVLLINADHFKRNLPHHAIRELFSGAVDTFHRDCYERKRLSVNVSKYEEWLAETVRRRRCTSFGVGFGGSPGPLWLKNEEKMKQERPLIAERTFADDPHLANAIDLVCATAENNGGKNAMMEAAKALGDYCNVSTSSEAPDYCKLAVEAGTVIKSDVIIESIKQRCLDIRSASLDGLLDSLDPSQLQTLPQFAQDFIVAPEAKEAAVIESAFGNCASFPCARVAYGDLADFPDVAIDDVAKTPRQPSFNRTMMLSFADAIVYRWPNRAENKPPEKETQPTREATKPVSNAPTTPARRGKAPAPVGAPIVNPPSRTPGISSSASSSATSDVAPVAEPRMQPEPLAEPSAPAPSIQASSPPLGDASPVRQLVTAPSPRELSIQTPKPHALTVAPRPAKLLADAPLNLLRMAKPVHLPFSEPRAIDLSGLSSMRQLDLSANTFSQQQVVASASLRRLDVTLPFPTVTAQRLLPSDPPAPEEDDIADVPVRPTELPTVLRRGILTSRVACESWVIRAVDASVDRRTMLYIAVDNPGAWASVWDRAESTRDLWDLVRTASPGGHLVLRVNLRKLATFSSREIEFRICKPR